MDEKMHRLYSLGIYTVSNLPAGWKAVGCKWIFKCKYGFSGEIICYNTRLVVKDYTQRKGKDFKDTFALVARMASMCIVCAIAAHENLDLWTIDIDSAYLNGIIDTKVYMKQPEGFVDSSQPNAVWLLHKGLYGLKQAGNLWNATIHAYILELRFKRVDGDLCIYLKEENGTQIIISLHVDDFFVATCKNDVK
jgi:hypothetical protein